MLKRRTFLKIGFGSLAFAKTVKSIPVQPKKINNVPLYVGTQSTQPKAPVEGDVGFWTEQQDGKEIMRVFVNGSWKVISMV
jgi:hypothetical protein